MGLFDGKKNCQTCYSDYNVDVSTAENKKLFCSIECENTRTCDNCEKEYNINKSNADDIETYCSKNCEEGDEPEEERTVFIRIVLDSQDSDTDVIINNLSLKAAIEKREQLLSEILSGKEYLTFVYQKEFNNGDNDSYSQTILIKHIVKINIEAE